MSFSKRLMRAIGGIVLALINATLILIIVAAVSVGYLVSALDRAAETGAARATAAAMDAAGIEPGALRTAVNNLTTEVAALRSEVAAGDDARATAALTRIDTRLEAIAGALQGLSQPTISISPETINALNDAIAKASNELLNLKDRATGGPAVPPAD